MVKPVRLELAAGAESPPSRQEPRRLRTRAALLSAGAALLAERPIDAIPVDDIVEAAGVAKGSFFNHFESKDAFATAIAAEIREEIGARVRAGNLGIADPAECVVRGVCVFARFALTEPGRARIMLRSSAWVTSARNPLNRGLEAHIADGVAQGRFTPRAGRAGVAFMVGLGHTLVSAITHDGLKPPAALALTTEILALALAGLGLAETEAVALASRVAADVINEADASSDR